MNTYGDLYNYLGETVDFRKDEAGKDIWDCSGPGKLEFVRDFCRDHKLDFIPIEKALRANGGGCDCEVLWNTQYRIADEVPLPSV